MTIVSDSSLHRTQNASISGYAEILGVSPCTVRRRIADGTIHAVRIGRLIRIPLDQQVGRPITVR